MLQHEQQEQQQEEQQEQQQEEEKGTCEEAEDVGDSRWGLKRRGSKI
jgi:hypothetical protein